MKFAADAAAANGREWKTNSWYEPGPRLIQNKRVSVDPWGERFATA